MTRLIMLGAACAADWLRCVSNPAVMTTTQPPLPLKVLGQMEDTGWVLAGRNMYGACDGVFPLGATKKDRRSVTFKAAIFWIFIRKIYKILNFYKLIV